MSDHITNVGDESAVLCRVLGPHLVYDTQSGSHTGAGGLVRARPRAAARWVRRGWAEIVTDEADTPAPDKPSSSANPAKKRTRTS